MQIQYSSYLNTTGYSVAAQDYILAMLSVDPKIDIKLNFLNSSAHAGKIGVSKNRFELFSSLQKKETKNPHLNIFHCIPPLYRRTKDASRHIGLCMYETIDPPLPWINSINNMDAIITASQFNKNIFENSGVEKPIYLVPHCFDPKLFNNEVQHGGRYEKFTFLSIGTWKKRKNFETLIKGFYESFNKNDNVCLLIKTDKPEKLKETVINIKKNGRWRNKNTASIYAQESKNCIFENIPKIMKKADIVVSPTTGEGFGLVGLHAMALGIPLVITRYSGVLEYAKPEYCTYFEPRSYERVSSVDGVPQFCNKIWPVITIEEISKKLIYAYKNINSLKIKSNLAYEYVHKNYTYNIIGKKLINILETEY